MNQILKLFKKQTQLLLWDKWQEAIQIELNNLLKRLLVIHPLVIFGFLVQKRNAKGESIHYKARFIAQGFTQWFHIDYTDTYSLIMDTMGFRWLIHVLFNEVFICISWMSLQLIFMVIWIKMYMS